MPSFKYINISYKYPHSLTKLLDVICGTFANFDHGYMTRFPQVSVTKLDRGGR